MDTQFSRGRAVCAVLIHALLGVPVAGFAGDTGPRLYRYSDCHLHYVDFFQKSEGMPTLLAALAESRVDHVMLSGIGVIKKWAAWEPTRPRFYLGDDAPAYWYGATDVLIARAYLAVPEEKRAGLHPFLVGFNPTDMNAVEHVRSMIELYPGVWQGIGEIFTRHDYLTALTLGERPRADHPALAAVYDLAARHGLPVNLHSNITSVREPEPIFLGELERALEGHRQTRFIWAHAGTSNEINRRQILGGMPELLDALLARHPNLWIDLSWSLLDDYLMEADGTPSEPWLALVHRYPDRFMLGSDVVGRFGRVGEQLRRFDPFLDGLPEETAHRVARDNFVALLPPRGAMP